MSAGYVYVLSNPSMPDLVKIGYSKYGGQARAKQLYKDVSGVPEEFKLEFEIWFPSDVEKHEKAVHEVLDEYRVNSSREFFRVSVDDAMYHVTSRINIHQGKYPVHPVHASIVYAFLERCEDGQIDPWDLLSLIDAVGVQKIKEIRNDNQVEQTRGTLRVVGQE